MNAIFRATLLLLFLLQDDAHLRSALTTSTTSKTTSDFESMKKEIQDSLNKGKLMNWEGSFVSGVGIHGRNEYIISKERGYVYSSKGRDMGRVIEEGDSIVLVSELTPKKSVRFFVVQWSERIYLVESSLILHFCNAYNAGKLDTYTHLGMLFYVKNNNNALGHLKGIPKVPNNYRKYILQKPINARIISLLGKIDETMILGVNSQVSGYLISIDAGKTRGICCGMKMYLHKREDFLRCEGYIVAVGSEVSYVLLVNIEQNEWMSVQIGNTISTANSLYVAPEDFKD